jgi:hypothetical protein
MANLNQDIRTLVDEFANRLTLTVRRSVLEQVVTAMGGTVPGKRGPGRPPASSKASGGAADAMDEKLLAHLQSNSGQRADQIAKSMGVEVKRIQPSMQRLLASKKVKRKGKRRGTTYFAA